MSKRLNGLRQQVELISVEILERLSQRARNTLEIASEKERLELPVRDPQREAKLLESLVRHNDGPFSDAVVRELFNNIITACVGLMAGHRPPDLRVSAAAGPRVTISVRGHQLGDAPQYMAGPCAVESEEQLDEVARGLAAQGVRFFRAGAFKPRTSPYSFQGLGEPGLHLLSSVAKRYDMVTVTEAHSPHAIDLVARHADIIQIGARNMYNYELLREAGRSGKPVLLKRAFSATLQEWLLAAEYISLGGSDQIILCERGIRTFARETRNTLDLSVVPLALARSRLPVIVDVSHAAGRRDILAPLAQAAFSAGACGVMVEVHPNPDNARSDAEQQLTLEDFEALRVHVAKSLTRLANALNEEPATSREYTSAHQRQTGGRPCA